jgi:hypothetical protein
LHKFRAVEHNYWLLRAKKPVKRFGKIESASSLRWAGTGSGVGTSANKKFRTGCNGDRSMGVTPWALSDDLVVKRISANDERLTAWNGSAEWTTTAAANLRSGYDREKLASKADSGTLNQLQ